ncbi:hypothetical protein GF324_12495, partial [bacterium]|nr:hypothetical protein [bacterium]
GMYCFDGSNPTVNRLTIDGAGTAGIVCELNSSPTITRTTLRNINGYGMHIMRNSAPHVSNSLIYNTSVTAFVVETLSQPMIEFVTVYGAPYGIRVTNTSAPTVENSIISFFENTGISAHQSSYPSLSYLNLFVPASAETAVPLEGTATVTSEVTGNPRFVNPSPDDGAADFSLQSGSACAGAASDGTDLGAYGGEIGEW